MKYLFKCYQQTPPHMQRTGRASALAWSHEMFLSSSVGKESVCNAGDRVRFWGWEDPLEKEMVTHSGILAWRIPRTEKPGGLHMT